MATRLTLHAILLGSDGGNVRRHEVADAGVDAGGGDARDPCCACSVVQGPSTHSILDIITNIDIGGPVVGGW